MTTNRQFSRFVRSQDIRPGTPTSLVPEAGLCLSVFLVLTEESEPNKVLMGIINREAPWEDLGALSPTLLKNFPTGWMLPSSNMLVYESPFQASKRVLHEQLGIDDINLSAPIVFSDVYDHPITHLKDHWDLGFIFKGSVKKEKVTKTNAWSRLEFIKPFEQTIPIIRSHGDVIKYSGL